MESVESGRHGAVIRASLRLSWLFTVATSIAAVIGQGFYSKRPVPVRYTGIFRDERLLK